MELIQAEYDIDSLSSNVKTLRKRNYIDRSPNDLTVLSGTCLQVAECMGTGILALPYDVRELGLTYGLLFLIMNLPINFYAGNILDQVANSVESQHFENHIYQTIQGQHDENESSYFGSIQERENQRSSHEACDSQTYNFIGLASALYKDESPRYTTPVVMLIFYLNLILVLGNYILVMSHAVKSFAGENMCLPVAGVIASSLMFGLSQISTMARLGRTASAVSLISLGIVICISLVAVENVEQIRLMEQSESGNAQATLSATQSLLQKFAALSSIGFAVGSQKLFLNIRHEFKDRNDATKSLGFSLTVFGIVYGVVCLFAGPNPPEFLFDAIGDGVTRKIAGLMLWIHVAISYSINSQALCSSIDRLQFYRVEIFKLNERHRLRWALLTFTTALLSYLIANAIPFFSDLVSLIGALTSVPLTLLLPAWFYRKMIGIPSFSFGRHSYSSRNGCVNISSLLLVTYSLVFVGAGILGSIYCIQSDWKNQRVAFGCV